MQVNVYQAKSELSALLEKAAAGEEIIIAKRGKPMAVLGPLRRRRPQRVPGAWKGAARVAADFDAPLPNDMLTRFEGGEDE